jgi:hypothetical protein
LLRGRDADASLCVHNNRQEIRMQTATKGIAGVSVAAAVLVAGCAGMGMQGQGKSSSPMSFFITSVNPGKGADFGGLAGADKHCQTLAAAAGAGDKTWRAYLSTTGPGGVNARDRIGKGPWRNAKGVVVATDVEQLHGANNINKETALTEKGGIVKARPDEPNEHNILTGSDANGRALSSTDDTTCRNWTSSTDGATVVGHHNREGTPGPAPTSWNSSHPTSGCSIEALRSTGGAGYLYCFAAN